MNIVQISLLLGHEHLQTTMVYLDITNDESTDLFCHYYKGLDFILVWINEKIAEQKKKEAMLQ